MTAPALMDDIVSAFGRCRRPTDFYKLRIAIENFLSPVEAAHLIALRDRLPAEAQDSIDTLARRAFSEISEPKPYERLRLGTHVYFYGHGPGEARRPDLLIAFCGSAQRLLLPIPVALQHMNADQFDVVVLTDPANRAYMMGIEGYADSFAGILRRLDADLKFAGYRSVRCFGASIGGVVALRAGLALDAERAVSVVGRPIRSYSAAEEVPAEALAAFDGDLARHRSAATRIVCAFGADHPDDSAGGRQLARDLGGEAVAVPGVSVHTLLNEMLKAGRLSRFLDDLLSGDRAAA